MVRANGIGDFVFALPALDGLRRVYPSAELTLIGRRHHAELLAGRRSPVDRVEVAPPYGGVTTAEGAGQVGPDLDDFFASMQARRFDLALQLHGGGGNSNPFTQRLGARVTAGFRDRGAPPLDRWLRYRYLQQEVLRQLEGVALVGARPPPSLEPTLSVGAVDRRHAERALGARRQPLAVLHPGATDPRRRWPVSRFGAVGRALRAWGFQIVTCGSAGDGALAAAVAREVGSGCRSIAGTTSLGGLLGVLERAALVVSNDTGPLHLAAAVGTATVGIYWCNNVMNGGPITVDRHRTVVSWRTRCPSCGTDCMTGSCDHDASFVADVRVADVLSEVDDLLATAPARSPERSGATRPDPPGTPA